MEALIHYQDIVKQHLSKTSFKGAPAELYEPIEYAINVGGKRLRPVICLLACELFGGKAEDAVNAALGLEVFHNFTLLHDDIMDKAPIRRGQPTVYKKWNADRAILSGDTMMVMAYDLLLKSPEHLLKKLFTIFNKIGIEVCEGQQYDMNFETQEDVTINEYLRMIQLKTAVLIGGSMSVGATIANASDEEVATLYRFGENLGMAFQLQDDWLDTFGDTKVFGKKTGGDIRENKKTYLYLKALEVANAEDKKKLQSFYSTDTNEDTKVEKVIALFNKYHISDLTKEMMETYYQRAMSDLANLSLAADKIKPLEELANFLMKRSF